VLPSQTRISAPGTSVCTGSLSLSHAPDLVFQQCTVSTASRTCTTFEERNETPNATAHSNDEDLTSAEVGNPLHNLPYVLFPLHSSEYVLMFNVRRFEEFWLRGKCKDYPPAEGEFLELYATRALPDRALELTSYQARWWKGKA